MFSMKSRIRLYTFNKQITKSFFEEETIVSRKKFGALMDQIKNELDFEIIKDELLNSNDLETDKQMTPNFIKDKLNQFVIGQEQVKEAVAVALRTRYRKRMMNKSASDDLRSHNIMIIGKSGSGKTEILRHTAKLCKAPFIKVEAVRYTEVGYHGDDVENIIINLFKKTKAEFKRNIKEIILNLRSIQKPLEEVVLTNLLGPNYEDNELSEDMKKLLHSGDLDNMEIYVLNKENLEKTKIKDLKNNLINQVVDYTLDKCDIDEIVKKSIEERGIVCIDEFDKLARDKNMSSQSRASDEGVQNNLLPLLDGTDIPITEGKRSNFYINTRNILFVALGAFQKVKPEDLIVEIQGRFPNKVKVNSLTKNDFIKILKNSKNNVLQQALKMLQTEGLYCEVTEGGIEAISDVACKLNQKQDDIGARRLMSVVDIVLQDISFSAPEIYNKYKINSKFIKRIVIDEAYVMEKCHMAVSEEKNLRKYVS